MKYYVIQVSCPLMLQKKSGWPESFVISSHMMYSRAIAERDRRAKRAKKWKTNSSYVVVKLSQSVA